MIIVMKKMYSLSVSIHLRVIFSGKIILWKRFDENIESVRLVDTAGLGVITTLIQTKRYLFHIFVFGMILN